MPSIIDETEGKGQGENRNCRLRERYRYRNPPRIELTLQFEVLEVPGDAGLALFNAGPRIT
jgi:hypothetical protein